jgi:hypothetical protein
MELITEQERVFEQRLARILIHVVGPYVAVVSAFVFSVLLVMVLTLAGIQEEVINRLTGGPFWVPEIIMGLGLGAFLYVRKRSRTAFVAWLLPGVFLLWSASSWQGTMSQYDSTWDTYFGKDCGGSECLYQLFLTVPFYIGAAYSIGACIAWLQRRHIQKA